MNTLSSEKSKRNLIAKITLITAILFTSCTLYAGNTGGAGDAGGGQIKFCVNNQESADIIRTRLKNKESSKNHDINPYWDQFDYIRYMQFLDVETSFDDPLSPYSAKEYSTETLSEIFNDRLNTIKEKSGCFYQKILEAIPKIKYVSSTNSAVEELDDANNRQLENTRCFIVQFATQDFYKDISIVTYDNNFAAALGKKGTDYAVFSQGIRDLAALKMHETLYRLAKTEFAENNHDSAQRIRFLNREIFSMDFDKMPAHEFQQLLAGLGFKKKSDTCVDNNFDKNTKGQKQNIQNSENQNGAKSSAQVQ